MQLIKNMRAQNLEARGMDANSSWEFSDFLLAIGEGRAPEDDLEGRKRVRLPDEMRLPKGK